MKTKDYPISAEQYLIKQYEEALEEIETLKQSNYELEHQLHELSDEKSRTIEQDEIKVLPVLETYYSAHTRTYDITEDTYTDFKKALKERNEHYIFKDFVPYAELEVYNINCIVTICGVELKCHVTFNNNADQHMLYHYHLEDHTRYKRTREEAMEVIWEKLALDLQKFEDSREELSK